MPQVFLEYRYGLGILYSSKTHTHATSTASDVHGYWYPYGFAGTGVTGMGTGHEIFTHDIPIPVWAGDGSVTWWHVSVFDHHQPNASATLDGCNISMRETGSQDWGRNGPLAPGVQHTGEQKRRGRGTCGHSRCATNSYFILYSLLIKYTRP